LSFAIVKEYGLRKGRDNMSQITMPHDHGQQIEKVLQKMPTQESCVEVSDIFKLVSDGSRLRILWLLGHCEECVCNIAAAMEMTDPAVSHHLRVLRKGGLIVSRREGKEVYYKLADTEQARFLYRMCVEMLEA
jgi:DNA-binding transcriptional ArsR family regulator